MIAAGTGGSIGAAVDWLQDVLLGSVAAGVAVVAIAAIGFMMLTGHTDTRRAARVILGCFIVFGASAMAQGLLNILSAGNETVPSQVAAAEPLYPTGPATVPAAVADGPADPYAGAALTR